MTHMPFRGRGRAQERCSLPQTSKKSQNFPLSLRKMKQNLLTHLMRLTILFLLVFGCGPGIAVAGPGLDGADAKPALSQTIGAESSSSKIGLGLTDWGIPSSQLTQFTSDLASAGDDLMNFFADKGEKRA